jgi:hypothetical protein
MSKRGQCRVAEMQQENQEKAHADRHDFDADLWCWYRPSLRGACSVVGLRKRQEEICPADLSVPKTSTNSPTESNTTCWPSCSSTPPWPCSPCTHSPRPYSAPPLDVTPVCSWSPSGCRLAYGASLRHPHCSRLAFSITLIIS